jgi:hypothetical protein
VILTQRNFYAIGENEPGLVSADMTRFFIPARIATREAMKQVSHFSITAGSYKK